MGTQSYTHRDLATALGVSETTIKSYRSKFPSFLPVAREGKPVRLHPEALDVCRRIRALFAEGLSITKTMQALRNEFKEYPLNRRLSIPQDRHGNPPPEAAAQAKGTDALVERIQALTTAQDMARQRMEQLELEVRNLATMEAASKSLIAELLSELRAARAVQGGPQPSAPGQAPATPDAAATPGPTALTARKIVTLHGPSGPVASYSLAREPRPAPQFPDAPAPASAFLDLPAVIQSERGEFLGLPGGQSVRRLVEVLSPEDGQPAAWFQETPESWACLIPLGGVQNRELLFERTTTPRGNLVGLIRRMRSNEVEASPAQLQELFRQLRDQLA
ncbi:MAG: MerR family transcriptional regulator [Desulfovibrio sp.]